MAVKNGLTLCWLLIINLVHYAPALDLTKCKTALGMESGAIADFQITASTAHDMGNVGPQHARYVQTSLNYYYNMRSTLNLQLFV